MEKKVPISLKSIALLGSLLIVGLLVAIYGITSLAFASNQTFLDQQISLGNILPDRVVVQTENDKLDRASFNALSGKQKEFAASARNKTSDTGFYSILLDEEKELAEIIAAYQDIEGVTYAGPEVIYRSNYTPDDTFYSSQWALNNTGQSGGTTDSDVDASQAWDTEKGSGSVVVAVVDSGVQFEHSEFAGNIWANPGEVCSGGSDDDGNGYTDDCKGYDFVSSFTGSGTNSPRDNDPSPCGKVVATPDASDVGDCNGLDDNGDGSADNFISHGTHVAGIIAAIQDNTFGISGVAPSVTIMPVRALTEDGIGTTTDVLAAMNYAIDEGADIINMSFGSDVYDSAFDSVVSSAIANDVLLIAAAGNANENLVTGSGCDSPVCNDDPDGNGANGVISIAATNDDDERASFSNYSTENYIDVSAPGRTILSTCYDEGASPSCTGGGSEALGEFHSMSGTSQAAPHASGVAALLLSKNPTLSRGKLAVALSQTGDDITGDNSGLSGCGGSDCTTDQYSGGTLGHSRVNADNILDPFIVKTFPTGQTRGESGDVWITGINTSFGGSSVASFGAGITINALTCPSATSCKATITVTNSTPLGVHDITITTGGEIADNIQPFTISNSILRISGPNRIETAIKVSKNGFPGSKSADAVIIARDDDFPDSLAASPLAGLATAPVLFTPTGSLHPSVKAEISRVLDTAADSTPDIYILGQTAAISSVVEQELKALKPGTWSVKRLGGGSRTETAKLIAYEEHVYRGTPTRVVIATESVFADALAGGVPASDATVNPLRMPILLTKGANLSLSTSDYLKQFSSTIGRVYLLGGTSAVSSATESSIRSIIPSVVRIAGANRYDTAARIARAFYPSSNVSASFASGLNYPDAIAGAWHSALYSSPLLLIQGSVTPNETADYVRDFSGTLLGGFLYGGASVIPANAHSFLESII